MVHCSHQNWTCKTLLDAHCWCVKLVEVNWARAELLVTLSNHTHTGIWHVLQTKHSSFICRQTFAKFIEMLSKPRDTISYSATTVHPHVIAIMWKLVLLDCLFAPRVQCRAQILSNNQSIRKITQMMIIVNSSNWLHKDEDQTHVSTVCHFALRWSNSMLPLYRWSNSNQHSSPVE